MTIKKAKVSSVDASVQNQLDRKFKEAEDALADAKAQVEDGKNQLEAGAGAAAGQLSAAEQQIAQGDAELMQGNIMTEYEERFSAKGNPICKYIISPQYKNVKQN